MLKPTMTHEELAKRLDAVLPKGEPCGRMDGDTVTVWRGRPPIDPAELASVLLDLVGSVPTHPECGKAGPIKTPRPSVDDGSILTPGMVRGAYVQAGLHGHLTNQQIDFVRVLAEWIGGEVIERVRRDHGRRATGTSEPVAVAQQPTPPADALPSGGAGPAKAAGPFTLADLDGFGMTRLLDLFHERVGPSTADVLGPNATIHDLRLSLVRFASDYPGGERATVRPCGNPACGTGRSCDRPGCDRYMPPKKSTTIGERLAELKVVAHEEAHYGLQRSIAISAGESTVIICLHDPLPIPTVVGMVRAAVAALIDAGAAEAAAADRQQRRDELRQAVGDAVGLPLDDRHDPIGTLKLTVGELRAKVSTRDRCIADQARQIEELRAEVDRQREAVRSAWANAVAEATGAEPGSILYPGEAEYAIAAAVNRAAHPVDDAAVAARDERIRQLKAELAEARAECAASAKSEIDQAQLVVSTRARLRDAVADERAAWRNAFAAAGISTLTELDPAGVAAVLAGVEARGVYREWKDSLALRETVVGKAADTARKRERTACAAIAAAVADACPHRNREDVARIETAHGIAAAIRART